MHTIIEQEKQDILSKKLYLSVIKVDIEQVQKWIDAGGDVNTVPHYMLGTPLCVATEKGYACVMNALIKAGADVNFQGMYVSIDYLTKDDPEADMYISNKDFENLTPLHIAAKEGDKMAIKILLDAGADLNAKDAHEMTPLDWTVKKGYTECSEVLIQYTLLRTNKEGVPYCIIKAKAPDCISKDFNLSCYWSSFKNQLIYERMKMLQENIGKVYLSLHKFLFEEDANTLAGLLSDKEDDLQQCLKEEGNIKKWKASYPLHADEIERMIETQYNRGMERKHFLDILAELLRKYSSDESRLDLFIKMVIMIVPRCDGKIINPLKEQEVPVEDSLRQMCQSLPQDPLDKLIEPFTVLTNAEVKEVKKVITRAFN